MAEEVKIRVSFKTPDALDEGLDDAIRECERKMRNDTDLMAVVTEDDLKVILDNKRERLRTAALNWITWGEYLDIVIDPDADTCIVQRSV